MRSCDVGRLTADKLFKVLVLETSRSGFIDKTRWATCKAKWIEMGNVIAQTSNHHMSERKQQPLLRSSNDSTTLCVCIISGQATLVLLIEDVVSQFNGTSRPKGSYSAKTGDNDCNVNSSHYSLSTALCESNSLSGQVWTKCQTRPDTQGAPRRGCSQALRN